MSIQLKVGSKYKTRDGKIVECVAIWSKPNYNNLQATILNQGGHVYSVTLEGQSVNDHPLPDDLVERIPDTKTIEGYIVVFTGGIPGSVFYATENDAKLGEKHGVKIVKVTGTYEVDS